jgi:two-component system cell cycle sensor histidine kinase/response regulator CckA
MRTYNTGLPASEQVGILVSRLAEAENALQAATPAQVDAGFNPHAHTILLRETQQALQATNERLRHLVAHSPVVIYSLKVDGETAIPLLVSENITRIVGYTPDEVLQPEWWAQQLHPEDRDRAIAAIGETITEGFCRIEYRIRHRDGSYRWIEDHARVIRDAAGKPFELTGVWTDTTDRRAAETKLRLSEASLAAAQRLAHLGSWEMDLVNIRDLAACPTRWSDELCRIFGEVPGQTQPSNQRRIARVHPDDRDRIRLLTTELLESGASYAATYRITRPDGEERTVHERAEFVPGGRVPRIMGSVQDVTRHARAEEARRQSEERFTRMFRYNPTAMACTDADHGRLLDVNDRFLETFGYTREEVLGRTTRELDLWADLGLREMILAQVAADGMLREVECRLRTKTGQIRVVSLWMEVLQFGEHPTYLWALSDITERKKYEDELRLQSCVLEKMAEGVNATDAGGRIIFSNPALDAMLGYERGTLVGRHVSELNDLPPAESQAFVMGVMEQLKRTGSWSGEITNRAKDGKRLLTRVRITLVEILGQQCSVTVREDITDKRKLESQLLRAQRMESLGRLAGGIAHDMNNILAPITMAVPMLRTGFAPQQGEHLLNTIEASAHRGAQLVRQLLYFGRGVDGENIPIRVRDVVRELEGMLVEMFPRNIEILTNVAGDTWPVRGDPTQLHQVLLNLCVNSRDAMPEGGTLRLTVKNVMIAEDCARHSPDARPGPHVQITVTDSGTGIPPQHMDKLFDPFFTTKDVGKGTGLGLATVAGIVKRHGGFVGVQSETGKGTTFDVHLPAAPLAADQARTARAELPPRGRDQLILVVDDEPNIRSIARDVLVRRGYRVLTASNGREAVAIVEAQASELKLVITDIDMPVMDGFGLIGLLRSRHPALKVVVSTGIQSTLRAGRQDELKKLGVETVMQKPYSPEEIFRAVHGMIGGEN